MIYVIRLAAVLESLEVHTQLACDQALSLTCMQVQGYEATHAASRQVHTAVLQLFA